MSRDGGCAHEVSRSAAAAPPHRRASRGRPWCGLIPRAAASSGGARRLAEPKLERRFYTHSSRPRRDLCTVPGSSGGRGRWPRRRPHPARLPGRDLAQQSWRNARPASLPGEDYATSGSEDGARARPPRGGAGPEGPGPCCPTDAGTEAQRRALRRGARSSDRSEPPRSAFALKIDSPNLGGEA